MDPLARRFVAASLAWLLLGTALGLALALPFARERLPPGTNPLAAHTHLQLYGFVTMMIFGIALHTLPRFEGQPLPHPRLVTWQFLAANAGLVLFAAGQLLGLGTAVAVGGVLMAVGVVLFVAQVTALWRRAGRPALPVGTSRPGRPGAGTARTACPLSRRRRSPRRPLPGAGQRPRPC